MHFFDVAAEQGQMRITAWQRREGGVRRPGRGQGWSGLVWFTRDGLSSRSRVAVGLYRYDVNRAELRMLTYQLPPTRRNNASQCLPTSLSDIKKDCRLGPGQCTVSRGNHL